VVFARMLTRLFSLFHPNTITIRRRRNTLGWSLLTLLHEELAVMPAPTTATTDRMKRDARYRRMDQADARHKQRFESAVRRRDRAARSTTVDFPCRRCTMAPLCEHNEH